MAIAANFPNLKPALSLDFANVGRLDPRVTFTRASTATYYDGVTTAKAEENLLIRSQDYSTGWTVTNLTPVTGKTAPDGTSTATEFTAGAANAVLTQGYTAIAGSYTFSVWLRRVTGTGDIEIAADNGTWTVKVITGTWARYDVTQVVAAGSKTAGIRVVTSGDAIEVWGAQLEQRSAVTAYTATTTQPITNYIPVLLTAQNGVPRFDHNPTTGAALGLEIEEQRTNLLLQSEDFSTTWSATRSSVTTNTIVAPNGTLTGDKLVEDTTASNTHFINQNITTTAQSYAFSVYLKAGERTWARLANVTPSPQVSAFFNLSSGTVGTVESGTTASITSVGNGWYRCTIVGTASGAVNGFRIFSASADDTVSYTGDGYSGIYIWGAQLEEGAFQTSYIATTTTALTRSADAASMTGTNFSSWYSAGEGTLYVDSQFPLSVFGVAAELYQSALNSIVIRANSTNTQGLVLTNNTSEFVSNIANVSAFKAALAYKTNDAGFSLNASSPSTDTSVILPSSIESLQIGRRGGGDRYINGTIKKIAYYPVRLSNAQLQALTG